MYAIQNKWTPVIKKSKSKDKPKETEEKSIHINVVRANRIKTLRGVRK